MESHAIIWNFSGLQVSMCGCPIPLTYTRKERKLSSLKSIVKPGVKLWMRDQSSKVSWSTLSSHGEKEPFNILQDGAQILWVRASFAILYPCHTFSRHATQFLLCILLTMVLMFPATYPSTPIPTLGWETYYWVMMCQTRGKVQENHLWKRLMRR